MTINIESVTEAIIDTYLSCESQARAAKRRLENKTDTWGDTQRELTSTLGQMQGASLVAYKLGIYNGKILEQARTSEKFITGLLCPPGGEAA